MNRTRSTLPVLMLLTLGCQPPAPVEETAPVRTDQEAEADMNALRDEWRSLANADDAAAVASFYTEDAVLTDAYGIAHAGRAAIQAALEESFAATSDLSIATDGVVVQGDMVAGHGTFSQTVAGPDGEMTAEGRWQVVCLYQPDGSLRLRLHQSTAASAPPSM